jgi:Fur family transcriptional regulator, ferric uptake regulator
MVLPQVARAIRNDFQQAVERLRDYVRANNLRYTPEREEIVRAVFELETHFSVAHVAEIVRRQGGKTSLTTIYRNMEHLVRAGLVNEVKCGRCTDEQIYEHIHQDQHHDHLTCIRCGRVVEFAEEAIEVLQDHVAAKYGFELVRHHLDLQGVCGPCRERERREKETRS